MALNLLCEFLFNICIIIVFFALAWCFIVKIHLDKSLNYCLYLNLLLLSQGVFATSTDLDQVVRETGRLQQLQEEQRKALEAKVTAPVKAPTKIVVNAPVPLEQDQRTCFDIDEIKIHDITLISSKEIGALKNQYAKQCVSANSISSLMSQLTQLYFQKGYVTARVYLPAQDIKNSKTLILNVDEGKVSQLTTTVKSKKSISIKTAAPFVKGKPLNLKDLEQALDQFNRVQSNHVTMQIQPGEHTGESMVIFDNEPSRRVHGYFSFDNKGQDSTGREQASLGLSVDNILGLNDVLSLSYSRSLPFETNRKDSEAYSAFYVVPFGYHTLSLSASRSAYDTTVITAFQTLHSSGDTEAYSMKLDSLLYRGRVSQLRSSIGLSTKENKAYLENVLLGVGSRKLTIADFGLNYSTQISNHYFNGYVNYQRGLKLLESLEDEDHLDKAYPKAQFDKFLYGVTYFKPFDLFNQKLMFSSSFNGQEALSTLYGSEQYLIGSLYTVRGFTQQTISGDRGFSIKNDLSLNKVHDLGNGVLSAKYYLGADYGKVSNKKGSALVGELSSASLGANFNFRNVSLDLLVTQPISKPRFLKDKDADFFFSTTFTF